MSPWGPPFEFLFRVSLPSLSFFLSLPVSETLSKPSSLSLENPLFFLLAPRHTRTTTVAHHQHPSSLAMFLALFPSLRRSKGRRPRRFSGDFLHIFRLGFGTVSLGVSTPNSSGEFVCVWSFSGHSRPNRGERKVRILLPSTLSLFWYQYRGLRPVFLGRRSCSSSGLLLR